MGHRLRRALSRPPVRVAALAGVLVLAGCPYGAEFPLGDPAAGVALAEGPAQAVDPVLLGAWVGQSDAGESVAVRITESGPGGLVITAANPDGGETESMPAVVTEIDGERFLSVYDEAWFLLNYRIADGTLRLRLVDDALFEGRSFSSPQELRAFVQAHLADPLLYGEAEGALAGTKAGAGAGEGERWDWVLERAGAAAPDATPAAAATAP